MSPFRRSPATAFVARRQALCCLAVVLLAAGSRVAADAVDARGLSADANAMPRAAVVYVTNRLRDEERESAEAFTGDRGAFQVGRCEARFTPILGLSQLATKIPFYIPTERKQLVVEHQSEVAYFWKALKASVDQSSSQSLVLFVHGYSNSFERTCLMAAELQRLLTGQATVLMFSWPSNGRPTDYVADQADLEWSVPLLSALLGDLGERFGADNVQLLAHSLGSRGAIFGLQRLAVDRAARPLVGRLVFLAPDFDAQTFVELLPRLEPLTGSITLYASSRDTPLRLSEELNGHPRLGQAGESLTVVPGMETIDISPAGLYQILGHEYFYYHPQVAADLVRLVASGLKASERPGLERRMRDGLGYWALLPQDDASAQGPAD
jgi:esterase/lipase superfamily enzyme